MECNSNKTRKLKSKERAKEISEKDYKASQIDISAIMALGAEGR
jgi:hypothetical protein